MTSDWTCLYCGGQNPIYGRFCTTCSAKKPEFKYTTKISADNDSQEISGSALNALRKYSLEIPKPGSLVGSLFALCNNVLNEEISIFEFGESVSQAIESVDSIFGAIYDGIGSTDTQAEEYKEQLLTLLENVQFMFVKALEEIFLYSQDQAPYHIRYGRMLAQRAELEYIQIVEMLVSDASGNYNPFEGAPFVLGTLAEEFYEGKLTLDEFKEQLSDFKNATYTYLEKGRSLAREGFALAEAFDGDNGDTMQAAIDKLSEAGDEISKAIINLHTKNEIKKTIKKIPENNTLKDYADNI
ncbi:MAG: hypothetical protein LWY06_01870 [Firmicutes bacterium]|nr:hypothetical protein [Bacillota bacterium]